MDISERFRGCLVPKLLLQPLVENALIHGVANQDDGYIKLWTEEQDGDLLLCVSDNGCGIPDDMLSPAQRKTKWEAIAEAVERTDKKNDERYIGFLSRGNIRAAKEMVLAAAKAAGYTHVGYHGTHAKPFTVFERGIAGIYLATNRKLAEDFATGFRGEVGTLYNLVAKIKKPFVVEEHINSAVPYYYNIPTPTAMRDAGYSQSTVSTEEIAHFAEDNGYDGVIIKGIREGAGVYTDDIIVFDSNQVKSADPVTYDDDGKVIPLSKRFDMENPDIRYALPEDATYVSPTAGAVGKTKAEYKADFRDNVFTAKTRTYIDTVDELYGIETYLRKVGKMDKAAVEALVQQARAARSQAQTMIGTAQYNVFSDKVERMGDGLLEILKPAQKWTEEKRIAFHSPAALRSYLPAVRLFGRRPCAGPCKRRKTLLPRLRTEKSSSQATSGRSKRP